MAIARLRPQKQGHCSQSFRCRQAFSLSEARSPSCTGKHLLQKAAFCRKMKPRCGGGLTLMKMGVASNCVRCLASDAMYTAGLRAYCAQMASLFIDINTSSTMHTSACDLPAHESSPRREASAGCVRTQQTLGSERPPTRSHSSIA